MAVTYQILDLDDKIAFVRTTVEDDSKMTLYVEKRAFKVTSSGTNVVVYNQIVTLPTTLAPYLVIPFADITYPLCPANNAASMAAKLQALATAFTDYRHNVKDAGDNFYASRTLNFIGVGINVSVSRDPANDITHIYLSPA